MSDRDSEEEYPGLALTLSPPGSRGDAGRRSRRGASTSTSGGGEVVPSVSASSSNSSRLGTTRSSGGGGGGVSKEERIAPPYPWSSERRAVVRPLEWLLSNNLGRIYGEGTCKKCGRSQMASVELQPSFFRLSAYFLENRHLMHDRAPPHWSNPRLLDCALCNQPDCLKPNTSVKKRNINWLFLFLTERLGLCTLEQLKYFCKHTRKHRTGAKDRVLYLTYAGILKQLDPSGPFD